jgi:hypothetical protein
MPLSNHPRSGLYLDPCAPHMRVRLGMLIAGLVSLVLWFILIFAAVAVYRYLRGEVCWGDGALHPTAIRVSARRSTSVCRAD